MDEQGRPARDPAGASHVGAIESSADFGHRLHAEAVRRDLKRDARVVVVSDGAEYNAIIAARCCLYSGRFEDFWADCAS